MIFIRGHASDASVIFLYLSFNALMYCYLRFTLVQGGDEKSRGLFMRLKMELGLVCGRSQLSLRPES